MAREMGAPILP